MNINRSLWGKKDGREIFLITVNNGSMELSYTNLGCTITAISVPDGSGNMKNLVLGYDTLDEYLNDNYFLGCIMGRVTGRISNGSFEIDGKQYTLARNDGTQTNHMHGGLQGFSKKVFELRSIEEKDNKVSATFYYHSNDMEEGYPGNLDLHVTYTLTTNNEVIIKYHAIADKATNVNLTNHCYFNFSGTSTPAIDHELYVDADKFVLCGEGWIPTGELKSVDHDPHDFRVKHRINKDWHELPDGFNECFVLNSESINHAVSARLSDPGSGTAMTLKTTSPGIVFYTGAYLSVPFQKYQGVCLETQFF
ncbi:MAG: aldose epimerase family protein, partial [Flavitalea sp.]